MVRKCRNDCSLSLLFGHIFKIKDKLCVLNAYFNNLPAGHQASLPTDILRLSRLWFAIKRSSKGTNLYKGLLGFMLFFKERNRALSKVVYLINNSLNIEMVSNIAFFKNLRIRVTFREKYIMPLLWILMLSKN